MNITEKEIEIPCFLGARHLIALVTEQVTKSMKSNEIPVRFAITETTSERLVCEIGIIQQPKDQKFPNIFEFKKRTHENTHTFNAALIIPTGVGAEIGGHAADATPVLKLLSKACDTIITHPNVVNGSDMNEMTANSIYVEGSVLTQLIMGSIGLQPVRSNRLLVVADNSQPIFVNGALNSVNAARAIMGLTVEEVIVVDDIFRMVTRYSPSGRATGIVENIDALFNIIDQQKNEFDAIAVSSCIRVPLNYHMDYFRSEGDMVNPWGGIEALLTHSISLKYGVPSAHSPMFESESIANMDVGVVDPRMAAEAISLSFFQCVLKGLHKSPKITTERSCIESNDILSAKDISCLVIPDGCLGLPTLAALEQGIPVIAVEENTNLMKNDLSTLPWQKGKFFKAKSYLEAVGVMKAIQVGISVSSVRRPFTKVATKCLNCEKPSEVKRGDISDSVKFMSVKR